MNNLFFVTGNKNKFNEAAKLIPKLQQQKIDLIEIQETSTYAVLKAKVEAARKNINGSFFVEDVSLVIDSLSPYPGTFVKWFARDWGLEKIVSIATKLGNTKAHAICCLGLWHQEEFLVFEGVVHGHVVMPRGTNGFGWDPIFCPQASTQTFAEMDDLQKQRYSMRALAINAMKQSMGM